MSLLVANEPGSVRLLPSATRPSATGDTTGRVDRAEGREVVRVDHEAGDRFAITLRDHLVIVDQPTDAGGEDTGPTPTELFVASLASCVAFYARRYLARHDIDTGLSVEASYHLTSKPARVGDIRIELRAPGLPESRRDALLAVAGHCTVHNSITQAPEISLQLVT